MTTFAVRSPALRRSSALSCATYGWGTPLLLIHGIGTAGSVFAPIIPALAAHFHLIVPDLRGFGRSSLLGNPKSVLEMAADLPALFDVLGVRRCHVLGFGHGGLVAQQLAAYAPQRIHRMALVATPAYPNRSLRQTIASGLLPHLQRIFGSKTLERLSGGLNSAHGAPEVGNAAAARLLLKFDGRPLQSKLDTPTLIIQGDQDSFVRPHHAGMLATSMPNSRLQMLNGAKHCLLQSHKEEISNLLIDWLH
jgi:3-oxoadipate enol-lactonase